MAARSGLGGTVAAVYGSASSGAGNACSELVGACSMGRYARCAFGAKAGVSHGHRLGNGWFTNCSGAQLRAQISYAMANAQLYFYLPASARPGAWP